MTMNEIPKLAAETSDDIFGNIPDKEDISYVSFRDVNFTRINRFK